MTSHPRRGRHTRHDLPPDQAARSAAEKTESAAHPAAVREEPGRVLLSVYVTPRAGRDSIEPGGDSVRVRLTAPPVEGAANNALISLLADRLGVARRAVTLVRGATSRHKLVAVAGISAAELTSRLGV